jgi:hypothetical protein
MYVVMLTVHRRPKFRVPSSIDLLVTAGHQTGKKIVASVSHVCMSAMLLLWTVGIGTYSVKKCPIAQFSCQFLWRSVGRFNRRKMRNDTHKVSGNKRCCREDKVYVFITRNYYVNLFDYKQRSLLHDSATYCGRFQGSVLWRIYYTEHQNNLQTEKLSFKEKAKIYFIYIVFFKIVDSCRSRNFLIFFVNRIFSIVLRKVRH